MQLKKGMHLNHTLHTYHAVLSEKSIRIITITCTILFIQAPPSLHLRSQSFGKSHGTHIVGRERGLAVCTCTMLCNTLVKMLGIKLIIPTFNAQSKEDTYTLVYMGMCMFKNQKSWEYSQQQKRFTWKEKLKKGGPIRQRSALSNFSPASAYNLKTSFFL